MFKMFFKLNANLISIWKEELVVVGRIALNARIIFGVAQDCVLSHDGVEDRGRVFFVCVKQHILPVTKNTFYVAKEKNLTIRLSSKLLIILKDFYMRSKAGADARMSRRFWYSPECATPPRKQNVNKM